MTKLFSKFNFKDFKPNLSLFLATALVVSFYLSWIIALLIQYGQQEQSTPAFSWQMIPAHVGLAIIWVLFFKLKTYWKYSYALFLLFALFPFIEFTNFGSSIEILGISISLISLFLLALHLMYNSFIISRFISSFPKQNRVSDLPNPESIAKFERKFSDKPDPELLNISTSSAFSKPAQAAAQSILDKRNSN